MSWDGSSKTVWIGKREGEFKYLSSVEYARSDLNGTAFHFNEWNKVGLSPYEYTGNFSITANKYFMGLDLKI